LGPPIVIGDPNVNEIASLCEAIKFFSNQERENIPLERAESTGGNGIEYRAFHDIDTSIDVLWALPGCARGSVGGGAFLSKSGDPAMSIEFDGTVATRIRHTSQSDGYERPPTTVKTNQRPEIHVEKRITIEHQQ
jgi:hypothetical protein